MSDIDTGIKLLPTRLLELREAAGLSYEDVAARMGVTGHTVYTWEACIRNPTVDDLVGLAALYGVTVHWLVFGCEYAPSDVAPPGDQPVPFPADMCVNFPACPVSALYGDEADFLPGGPGLISVGNGTYKSLKGVGFCSRDPCLQHLLNAGAAGVGLIPIPPRYCRSRLPLLHGSVHAALPESLLSARR